MFLLHPLDVEDHQFSVHVPASLIEKYHVSLIILGRQPYFPLTLEKKVIAAFHLAKPLLLLSGQ